MRLVHIALALMIGTGVAAADEKIKLGTLAPSGSTWHTLLKEMGQKWSEASNGQVSSPCGPRRSEILLSPSLKSISRRSFSAINSTSLVIISMSNKSCSRF